jgi:invasion protein IalB
MMIRIVPALAVRWSLLATVAAPLAVMSVPAARAQAPTPAPGPISAYTAWTKVCTAPPRSNGQPNPKPMCVTGKDARTEQGGVMVAVALVEPEGEQAKRLHITLPLGLMVSQGTRLIVDQDPPLQTPFTVCRSIIPNMGCIAEYDATPDLVTRLKKGRMMTVQAVNLKNDVVSYPFTLADFAAANEGRPAGAKAYDEQQKKMLDDLQTKADELPAAPAQRQAAQTPGWVYSPWTKTCAAPPNSKPICFTNKDAITEQGVQVVAVTLVEMEGETKRVFRITLPFGVAVPMGMRLIVDQDPPLEIPFTTCLPLTPNMGCIGQYDAAPDLVTKVKKGRMMTIQAVNQKNEIVSFPLALADFAKANEGPATDPKVYDEQRKKMQEALQKKRTAPK